MICTYNFSMLWSHKAILFFFIPRETDSRPSLYCWRYKRWLCETTHIWWIWRHHFKSQRADKRTTRLGNIRSVTSNHSMLPFQWIKKPLHLYLCIEDSVYVGKRFALSIHLVKRISSTENPFKRWGFNRKTSWQNEKIGC